MVLETVDGCTVDKDLPFRLGHVQRSSFAAMHLFRGLAEAAVCLCPRFNFAHRYRRSPLIVDSLVREEFPQPEVPSSALVIYLGILFETRLVSFLTLGNCDPHALRNVLTDVFLISRVSVS